ncbi:MAG: class I SAM-dependent RNA methyltransferase, partial [Acidobacteriaceae bacterium]|nr:class I SAM-dependent RNA methyltransferase [Acidobacteriaceae bacterium]
MSSEPSPQLELHIEKLVYGGDGLARSDGRVVLTPFVLPGETVTAEVRRAKNDLLRGDLRQVLHPSEARIEPSCPYFFRCGGCHYQHAPASYQASQKIAILREVLRRVGHVEFDRDIEVVEGEPWHYRNRVQLHIDQGHVGYFSAGSHDIVAIDHCPISSPKLNDIIGALARDLPHYRWFGGTVELFTNETEVQVNVLDRIPPSVRPLFENLGSAEPIEYAGFRVSRNSFFQVNRFLVDALVETAVRDSSGDSALDLYAGVGLFATHLARA